MQSVRYIALNGSGTRITGQVDAEDEAAAIRALQDAGYFPIRTSLIGMKFSPFSALKFGKESLRPNSLAIATQELGMLLGAGLPLPNALDIASGIGSDRRLRDVFLKIRDHVQKGMSLTNALASYPVMFSPFYTALVRAGEATGSLDLALVRLAEYLTKAHAIREQVKSALVYPIILLVTAGISISFVMLYVLPQFKPLFAEAGASLPFSTRLVMGCGDFMVDWGWLLVILMIAAWFGLKRALRNPSRRRRLDADLLRLPWVGRVLGEREAGRFARTLGTLLKAGLTVPSALSIARATLVNTAMREAISLAEISVRSGETLGALLARSRLFPELASQMVRVGEETGRLDEMLLHQADLFERNAARAVDRLVTALVPVLTMLLGGVVAGIVVSVLSAILKINDLAM